MTDTTKKAHKRKAPGPFSDELLDQLLAQVSGKDAESLLGESDLIGQLKKQLAEQAGAPDTLSPLRLKMHWIVPAQTLSNLSSPAIWPTPPRMPIHIPQDTRLNTLKALQKSWQ